MENIIGLLLTFGVGLFILIGTFIVFLTSNNEKIISFFISMAFGVMILLVFMDLFPEAFELLEGNNDFLTLIIISVFSLLGMSILKLLDLFIPNHEHNHGKEHGELNNLEHIGLISSIALVLHNIIEGMALYGVAIGSVKLGLMLCIGIGLHNIPMGLVISSTFYKSNNSVKKTLLISLGLSLSTFIGGLLFFILNGRIISDFTLGIFICITLGMIVYIALFELLPKMICTKDKRVVVVGTLLGLFVLFMSSLF